MAIQASETIILPKNLKCSWCKRKLTDKSSKLIYPHIERSPIISAKRFLLGGKIESDGIHIFRRTEYNIPYYCSLNCMNNGIEKTLNKRGK